MLLIKPVQIETLRDFNLDHIRAILGPTWVLLEVSLGLSGPQVCPNLKSYDVLFETLPNQSITEPQLGAYEGHPGTNLGSWCLVGSQVDPSCLILALMLGLR